MEQVFWLMNGNSFVNSGCRFLMLVTIKMNDEANNLYALNGKDEASFFYSLDGKVWKAIGRSLKMKYNIPHFMGYRFALFNYATKNIGGAADFDFFRITDSTSTEK